MGGREERMEKHDPAEIEAEVEANARTPEEVAQEMASSADAGTLAATGGPLKLVPGGKKSSDAPPGDAELRDRFLTDGKRYAYGQGVWREYADANGFWTEVSELRVKDHVSRIIEAAESEGVKTTLNKISSVSGMAKIRVAVDDELWDADPDVIGCRNGVLHIPTRTLLAHSPDRYLTSVTDYGYDPSATAPTWDFFLSEFASREKVEFLQEFMGYALIPDTSHELAAWMYGPRGGGRSTFTVGGETVLGARAGTLGLAKIEQSQFALGGIAGKTLLTATEQPGGYTTATYILNALISGDKLEVERKYRDPYDLYPKAKLLWSMNALPRVQDPGDGLFRRVAVVEIPKPEGRTKDPTLKEKIKGEGAGILNWALAGLARLQARGRFQIPAAVQEATSRFELKNDIPAAFIEEVCSCGTEFSEQATPLYKAYQKWCQVSGHRPQSMTSIADDWERMGFAKYTSRGKRRYQGLSLNLEALEDLGIEMD